MVGHAECIQPLFCNFDIFGVRFYTDVPTSQTSCDNGRRTTSEEWVENDAARRASRLNGDFYQFRRIGSIMTSAVRFGRYPPYGSLVAAGRIYFLHTGRIPVFSICLVRIESAFVPLVRTLRIRFELLFEIVSLRFGEKE